ncbi:MAG TPA: class I SAM-dependent methyltransferase [Streptosporangiaceae bacterium]|nr:class I SAM-dependent methyltransferase [Streptosporangiaceae bacterium]
MTVRDVIRPIPGVRQISLLRQRLSFSGSAEFWERRYATGGASGPGSYGALAHGKAVFLNAFVRSNNVQSVIEFGCGDGNQLSLAEYPSYVGLDVSRSAIRRCMSRFADDSEKNFFLYDSTCFVDRSGLFKADLALSLDVVYHLIEDSVFEIYMEHLFDAADRYVIVYATNGAIRDDAPHVRHRCFSSWVDSNCPRWRLKEVTNGPASGPRRADFYVYEYSSEPT